jgi:hypothetical protein
MNYICPRHKIELPKGSICCFCEEFLKGAHDPENMTVAERLKEFDWWYSKENAILTVKFLALMERLKGLLGCEIFVHELVSPDRLRNKIISPQTPFDNLEDAIRFAQELAGDKLIEFYPDTQEIIDSNNRYGNTSTFDSFVDGLDIEEEE